MMESKDIRVQKTIKTIEDVFLNLIKEKTFTDITIKDICDEAMISRSTFYSHYKDKYDLLEHFFEKIISNSYVKKNCRFQFQLLFSKQSIKPHSMEKL